MAVVTPAVPASTVVQPNLTGQWVDVAITGGTVTSVLVNGVQVATATGVNVAIPPGGNIAITYSVLPSWAWTDPLETGEVPVYSAENLVLINEIGQLPWPAHSEGGEAGLGVAVDN